MMKDEPNNSPQTVVEAVDRLISELPRKDKTKIANMDDEKLIVLHFSLGMYIRDKFGLWSGNAKLMESCCSISGDDNLHVDDASFVIIDELRQKLRKTNVLRVVK